MKGIWVFNDAGCSLWKCIIISQIYATNTVVAYKILFYFLHLRVYVLRDQVRHDWLIKIWHPYTSFYALLTDTFCFRLAFYVWSFLTCKSKYYVKVAIRSEKLRKWLEELQDVIYSIWRAYGKNDEVPTFRQFKFYTVCDTFQRAAYFRTYYNNRELR